MSMILAGLRAWYGVAGRVAPGLAARQAARFFRTPAPRLPPSRWSEGLHQPEHALSAFDGEMLDVWTWEVGRPSVLLVHDWGGCGEQLSAFIRPILDAGFGVVAFDGPAHGRSKAVETDLRTFSRFIRQVVTQFPTIRTAIGHSFGGSSLTLAVGRGLPLARVAMIAPFARSERNVARLSRVLALPAELEARTSASLRASLEEDAEAWDLASFSTDLDTPVLIVHDEDDREVDVSEGREIAARWPGARLMITRGLGHRRVVSAPEVTERVVKFLAGTQPD